MTEPTTAAGRALLELVGSKGWPSTIHNIDRDQFADFLARIEVEARQQDASALREGLERLLRFTHALTAADHAAPLRAGANLDDLFAAEKALAVLPPSAPAGLDVERLMAAYNATAGTGTEECECGLTMDAHCGGFSLMHHDEYVLKVTAAEYARLEQDHP